MFPFLSINIETTDGCNRKCEWCPNAKIDKPAEFMDLDLFEKILAELSEEKYRKRVHLYQRGEPLLDDRLTEWTARVREVLPAAHIFISTNGDYLTRQKANELLRAGMNEIWVSHYDGLREDLVKETAHLEGIVYHFDKPQLETTYFNRGGKVDVASRFKMDNNFCWWIFRKAGITCRGDLQLCCADWFPGELGNVRDSRLKDIWPGTKLYEYWMAHTAGHAKDMPKCKDCNLLT